LERGRKTKRLGNGYFTAHFQLHLLVGVLQQIDHLVGVHVLNGGEAEVPRVGDGAEIGRLEGVVHNLPAPGDLSVVAVPLLIVWPVNFGRIVFDVPRIEKGVHKVIMPVSRPGEKGLRDDLG
jgi:hypothetical protein